MKIFFKCAFVLLFFTNLASGSLVAQENFSSVPLASFEHIPDSTALRKTIAANWLLQDISLLEGLKPTDYTDGTGKRFSVECVSSDEVLEIRIIPYDTDFYNKKNVDKVVNAESEQQALLEKTTNETTELPLPESVETKTTVMLEASAPTDETTIAETAKAETTQLAPPENLVPAVFDTRIPQGTWVLRRDKKTGEPISITIYLRESSDLFIVLHPAKNERIKDKSLIDFCLFGAYVRRDVAIAFDFESLYYTPLNQLKERTKNVLPWEIFSPLTIYSTVEATSKIVAQKMKSLVYIDDGAFDENGVPRYIETGATQTESEIRYASNIAKIPAGKKIRGGVNNFGFVKWIVDGIIKPVAGSGTYINSLKKTTDVPNTGFTKSFLEKRNLFLGLDWIRNLAAARLSLTMQKTVYPHQLGVDVKVEPFSFSLPVQPNPTIKQKFAGYFKSAGYQIEYLKPLLYYLACTEPGNFYLATVNYETGTPSLRQYNHVVAIFPYFDLLGIFHIDIYENATSTNIERFVGMNRGSFISLVRVKAPEIGFFVP